ncbi:MAG TPA: hypothetical protein VGF76_05690 [Polyangiaceae bacterium]
MSSPYTTFGLPPDGVAWAALAIACALAPVLYRKSWQAPGPSVPRRILLPALTLSATLLSAGYVVYYLRSGPRIIDATSYYLQARAMAHGHFAFPVLAPSGSFRGRFLLENAQHSLSVIFPPGYAAVLAVGFLLHAPMAVGPVIAGLLVIATYALAKQLTGHAQVASVAAALSVSCAALRYHTADTMSHGWCALLLCVGAFFALRARRWDALLCGLACGWLLATRPVSGAVGALLALSLLQRNARSIACFSTGLVPGIALLLLYQHAATGSYWASTQLAYYALADGPEGCFRYGFGRGIGCLYEHGEYVRARLPNGYGLGEAARVTLRRLAVHSIDVANAAPLSALCFVGAWLARGVRGVRPIFFGCLGLICAYAPFYFDGSFPGGGARLFADVLPLEHVLLAIAVVRLRWSALALPLSLAGFALHASFSHRALAEREGGRPMFEAKALSRAGVDHGLLFVDTDHGFNLGHDPGQFDAQHGLVVARYEHDAHDWLLWNRLARPLSYRYQYNASSSVALAQLVPYVPADDRLRFEAEAEWPPLAVHGGWAEPGFSPCASGGRGLALHPTEPTAGMSVDLELTGLDDRPHRVRIGWVRDPNVRTETVLRLTGPKIEASARVLEEPEDAPSGGPRVCTEADLGRVILSTEPRQVRLEASASGLLDYLEILP